MSPPLSLLLPLLSPHLLPPHLPSPFSLQLSPPPLPTTCTSIPPLLHLLPPSLNKLPHRFQLPPLPTSPPSASSCSTLTSTLSNLKHQLICTCRTKTCMRVKVFYH